MYPEPSQTSNMTFLADFFFAESSILDVRMSYENVSAIITVFEILKNGLKNLEHGLEMKAIM